ncbi:MAG: M61 family metallopeptidase [Armatimonadetes bacterium]|nr:M61 family metallopeptidase [Armatimonadota bacterium]
MRKTSALLLALVSLCLAAEAKFEYTVKMNPDEQRLEISIRTPVSGDSSDYQMPNWAPGAYILAENHRRVENFKVTDDDSKELTFEKPNNYTWRVSHPGQSAIVLSYHIRAAITNGAVHYSGPSTYLYAVGRKTEPCLLRLSVPQGWKTAIGLDELEPGSNDYIADSYDILADNPVSMGDLIIDEYRSGGKPHFIVYRGAGASVVDRDYVKRACKHISDFQIAFFGGAPFNKFVWHFNVSRGGGGAGGLEHLTSTQISFGSNVTNSAVSVFSHEYFHLWNVKRIRSKTLGPFDYTILPRTGALWWLEGVTDYYAHLLLFRGGWWGKELFFNDVIGQVRSYRSMAARTEVSLYEASEKVGDANNGRGNSSGFRINYYTGGWVAGMCLDIELRSLTNNRHSLDDVMRALWEICKDDKPGFEEDEIRKQMVRFGGEAMGAYYDKIIRTPGDMNIDEQLAKVGLVLENKVETTVDSGITYLVEEGAYPKVRFTRGAASDALETDDLILSVNGSSLEGKNKTEMEALMTAHIDQAKPDSAINLKVRRSGEAKEVSVMPTSRNRTVTRIVEQDDPTKARAREAWFYAGKKPERDDLGKR